MATTKQVIILARVAQKNCPQVFYKVRASEPLEIGEETEYPIHYNGRRYAIYTVRLVNGKVQTCNCPSHKPCYHMVQLEQKEQDRSRAAARNATLAKIRAAAADREAEIDKEIQEHIAQELAATPHAQPSEQRKIADLGTSGTLTKKPAAQAAIFLALPSRQAAKAHI